MATVLKSYDWSVISHNNKKARSRAYPWNKWFDGRIWKLESGVDFDGPATSLERVIRTTANRRGMKVRIRIDGDDIVMQYNPDGGATRERTHSPTLKSLAAQAGSEGTNGHKAGPVATKPRKRAVKATGTAKTATPSPTRRRKIVHAPA